MTAAIPTAYATLPWQIVLGIIVFNIIVGIVNKSKQKAPKPGSPAARKQEEAREKLEAARAKARAQAEQEAAARQAREARDARDEGAAEAATAAPARKDKAMEVGKDILGQLAKELGLELPETARKPSPAAPAPQPAARAPEASARAKSAAASRPVEPARPGKAQMPSYRPERVAAERAAAEREKAVSLKDLLAAQKAESAVAGENAPRRTHTPGSDPSAEPVRSPAAPLLTREELADADSLRRAFILKTVLDKPLALQRSRA